MAGKLLLEGGSRYPPREDEEKLLEAGGKDILGEIVLEGMDCRANLQGEIDV